MERRSKGKLYLCQCRLTGSLFTVRRIQIDVANAGSDDGVPASILRECNHSSALDTAYIQGLHAVEVEGKCVTMAQPFFKFNLRQFLQAN